MERIKIGFLGYDGVTGINLMGPTEAFASATVPGLAGSDSRAYEVTLIALDGDHFTTDAGMVIKASVRTDGDIPFHTLVIPGGTTLRTEPVAERVAEWIGVRARHVRRVVSICSGIYGLAPTGLLDGRKVTTHWKFARDVASRFPRLRVNEQALFLRDGKYYTSGGASAGMDLALGLIEEDWGNDVALSVAQTLLIYRRRDGSQDQYCDEMGKDRRPNNRIGPLVQWIEDNLDESLRLDALTERASLSYNELIVRFKESCGVTPAAFIKKLRLWEAKRRLGRGDDLMAVAKFAQFRTKGYFSQEFKWRFGIKPEDYRRRFGPAWAEPD